MKPIAICRHDLSQGPAYLETFLAQHDIPYRLFAIDAGDAPPTRASEFSGIVLLGSNASANDGYSWIRREDRLLQDALQKNCPILGHCFGGQMLARALGANVRRNSVPHIGWGKVWVTTFSEAKYWMGSKRELDMFHWHFETFSIPRGAKRVLFGRHCMNKGFALGPHLALQSHLEVTADSIRAWCASDYAQIEQHQHLASVQSEARILQHLDEKVAALHQIANHTYQQWLSHIAPARLIPLQHIYEHQRPHGGACWGHMMATR